MRKKTNLLIILLTLYSFLLGGYAAFSYSLTDPNLVLTQAEWYWRFQEFMWSTFFHDAKLLTTTYTVLILALFGSYLGVLAVLHHSRIGEKAANWKHVAIFALVTLPLLLSYNALSHDVFNYMFNARMVLKYQENPHVRTALEFAAFDDWTRFMHNTHTPAPYGYGWTAVSLVPSFLGAEKFLPTWLLYRCMSVLSILLSYLGLRWVHRVTQREPLNLRDAAVFFLNPLVLIELVGNMHNDLWMMSGALFGFGLLVASISTHAQKRWLLVSWSVGMLLLSVSIKLATLALLPVWLVLIAGLLQTERWAKLLKTRFHLPEAWLKAIGTRVLGHVSAYVPLLASASMFVPLFTQRSQQFLPWYLVWSLVWLPLIKQKWWKFVLLAFSIAALLRYIPWMYQGGYTDLVHWQERAITWLLPTLLFLAWFVVRRLRLGKSSASGDSTLRRIE